MPVITVRIKYHLFFPICCWRRGSGLYWRDDVCSAVYRYYFCTNCTNTQCLLRRRTFASWVILIGCAKTDGRITGNITGSFCICLLANTAWPSYRRIARSISNKITQCSNTTESTTLFSLITIQWLIYLQCNVTINWILCSYSAVLFMFGLESVLNTSIIYWTTRLTSSVNIAGGWS